MEVTVMTKNLMKQWKEQFSSKKLVQSQPNKDDKDLNKLHRTGVPMRDNIISKFFEFFCNAITEI